MPLAFIHFIDGSGRPVDPGYGVDAGGPEIDNTLPIPNPAPGTPGHLPSVPINWPIIPSHPIYRPRPGRPVDPGFGVGEGHPDNSLPPPIPNPDPGEPGHLPAVPPGWPIYPSHPIVRPPHWHHPDHGLPPDNGHPGIPGVPDNSLPSTPPPTVPPGTILVIVKGNDGKWHWATVQAGSPPTTLPEPTPTPPMAPGGGTTPQPKS